MSVVAVRASAVEADLGERESVRYVGQSACLGEEQLFSGGLDRRAAFEAPRLDSMIRVRTSATARDLFSLLPAGHPDRIALTLTEALRRNGVNGLVTVREQDGKLIFSLPAELFGEPEAFQEGRRAGPRALSGLQLLQRSLEESGGLGIAFQMGLVPSADGKSATGVVLIVDQGTPVVTFTEEDLINLSPQQILRRVDALWRGVDLTDRSLVDNMRLGLREALRRAPDEATRVLAAAFLMTFEERIDRDDRDAPPAIDILQAAEILRDFDAEKLPAEYSSLRRLLSAAAAAAQLIPSPEEIKRYPTYRATGLFKGILEREQALGVDSVVIERAEREMGEILRCTMQRLSPQERKDPLRVVEAISEVLAKDYKFKTGLQGSLAEGLASHHLDCDTLSYLYVELGRHFGHDLHPYVGRLDIKATDGSQLYHMVVGWKDSRGQQMFWETTSQLTGEQLYRGLEDFKQRWLARGYKLTTVSDSEQTPKLYSLDDDFLLELVDNHLRNEP